MRTKTAPAGALKSFKSNMDRDIKRIKRKYLFLKIKWTLLFVLPILLIVLAYQTLKQYLRLKMRSLGGRRQHTSSQEEHKKMTEQDKAAKSA